MPGKQMPGADTRSPAKVYLVGAGPGDPGLLTLRGADCLRRADVVLYDYLVNPQIVSLAPPSAERICLGQHGRSRLWTQDEINSRLIDCVSQGRTVVRLKNGDPAVFARAAEETSALIAARIPFEIIPGITAGLAAASCAGIPITHRQRASAVALVTGHEDDQKVLTTLDYVSLARFPGTLIFYMGVTAAPIWSTALMAAGKPPDTPVALVRRCSLPDQKTVFCTLGDVDTRIRDEQLRPPAVVMVGSVATPTSAANWFEGRPLSGRRILVTRAAHQASELVGQLQELGADTVVQPAIEIAPPLDWEPVDRALAQLPQFDWLVFSSANGVRYLLDRLLAGERDLRALGTVRLAAMGPGTAEELARYRLRADLQPDTYRAEALAAALARNAQGKKFLLARANRGREVLASELEAAGGIVQQIVVYRSLDCTHADSHLVESLAASQIDYVTVTSSAIALALHRLLGRQLSNTRLVSISPVTSQALREVGLPVAVEATDFTMRGIIDAILRDVNADRSADRPDPAAGSSDCRP
jgi:uroporphyrinogen III methyltransferase/synthase